MPAGARNTPPPMIDKIVRLVVWTAIVGALLGPIMLFWRLSQSCAFGGDCSGDGFAVVSDRLVRSRTEGSGIIAGPDASALARDLARLRELTGTLEDARRSKRVVEVILVRTAAGEADKVPASGGYRPMHIDISEATYRAALLVADTPLAWTVVSRGPDQRGFLAVEGPAPFNISGGHAGLLAGLRIEAFGAVEAARPGDYGDDRANPGRWRLCRALAQWSSHFAVPMTAMDITVVEDPVRITLSDRGIAHDGSATGTDTASLYCAPH